MVVNVVPVLALLLVSLAAGHSASPEDECPKICPALLAPTCATDGASFTQFDNPCLLRAANCKRAESGLKELAETAMEWCSSQKVDNLVEKLGDPDLTTAACRRGCPLNYVPLCASDGRFRGLVSNECEVELINCALGDGAPHLKVLGQGSC